MFVDDRVGVYVDSETARFHFNQFQETQFRFDRFIRSIPEFLNNQFPTRIATFHVPFPKETTWLDRLEQVYNHSDMVIIFCSELHEPTVEQLINLDKPKISLYVCGHIYHEFKHAQIHKWMDWFHTSSEFYARRSPGFLDTKLNPYEVKPQVFDILLGNQRRHRDFAHNYVQQHNLTEKVIMTYVHNTMRSLKDHPNFILETDGIEFLPDRKLTHSVDSVKYHGCYMTVSQVVPISIYNQTAYTLVTETNAHNEFNFYTEKIVKPMLARRLFVVISGQGYLNQLQKLGFQTFSGIIDESYDSIGDYEQRWNAAMDQVNWLCQQPQEKILQLVQPIAEHNYQLITEKNWYREFNSELEAEVTKLIDNTEVSPTSIT